MQVLVIEEILCAVWWQCLMSVDGQATSVLQLFASPSSLPKEGMILSLELPFPHLRKGGTKGSREEETDFKSCFFCITVKGRLRVKQWLAVLLLSFLPWESSALTWSLPCPCAPNDQPGL